jgi:hypothetical protein
MFNYTGQTIYDLNSFKLISNYLTSCQIYKLCQKLTDLISIEKRVVKTFDPSR